MRTREEMRLASYSDSLPEIDVHQRLNGATACAPNLTGV
jgi:hypothetical protein